MTHASFASPGKPSDLWRTDRARNNSDSSMIKGHHDCVKGGLIYL